MTRTDTGIKIAVGIVVLAIVAAIAIPNLLSAKISWNDWAAHATLRNLASVEAQFQSQKHVDVDGDGVGEFGTFGEMTATAGVRRDAAGTARGPALGIPALSPALANVSDDGLTCKSGYCFRLLLPAAGGGPTREGSPRAPLLSPVDVDASEKRWSAYAWPVRNYGELKGDSRDHNRAFYVNETGEVWQTINQDQRYCGPTGGPSWDAAMPEDGWGTAWTSPPTDVKEYRGRDGNVWRITN